jgi:transcription termination factor NusA
VGEITANLLHEAGYTSAKEVAETSLEELLQSTTLTEKKAAGLIAAAKDMIGSKKEGTTAETASEAVES